MVEVSFVSFVTEPSLEAKGTRKRSLLLSQTKSHVAKFKHRKSNARSRVTPLAKSRLSGSDAQLSLLYEEADDLERDRVGRDLLRFTVSPTYSTYLKEAYGGSRESAIRLTTLFNLYVSLIGPTYWWPLFKSEAERSRSRQNLINGFLNDPAQAEVMLALLQAHHDRDNDSGQLALANSSMALFHQSKALLLLRRKLNDPVLANEAITLWTVVSHLVLNQATNDEQSFSVNLYGLQRLLVLHGGMDAIEQRDPRLSQLIRIQETSLQNQSKPTPTTTPSEDTPLSPSSETNQPSISYVIASAIRAEASPVSLGELEEGVLQKHVPTGFFELQKQDRLRFYVVGYLLNCVTWLYQYMEASPLESDATSLVLRMLDILSTWAPNEVETSLCVSMGILLLSSGTWHDKTDLSVVRKQMRGFVTSLIDKRRTTIAAGLSPQNLEDYELWTSLVVAGAHKDLQLSPPDQWFLLQSYISERRLNTLVDWNDVKPTLEKFYVDNDLEVKWHTVWNIAQGSLTCNTSMPKRQKIDGTCVR